MKRQIIATGVTQNAIMKVGFIGLGHMGAAMAGSLLQAGHEVTIYNRTPSKAEGLIDRGARLAARMADVCHGDAVITMLEDDDAVEGVVLGEAGVLQSLGKHTVHISMSTISVALCERLVVAHASAGQEFVAAPVFGRTDLAAAGRLFIVAAGSREVAEELLRAFG